MTNRLDSRSETTATSIGMRGGSNRAHAIIQEPAVGNVRANTSLNLGQIGRYGRA